MLKGATWLPLMVQADLQPSPGKVPFPNGAHFFFSLKTHKSLGENRPGSYKQGLKGELLQT